MAVCESKIILLIVLENKQVWSLLSLSLSPLISLSKYVYNLYVLSTTICYWQIFLLD